MADVSPAALNKAAQELEDKHALFTSQRNYLDSEKGQLLAGWSSSASRSFSYVHDSFIADFNKVLDALHGMQENLRRQGATYTEKNETAKQAVSDVLKFLDTGA